MPSARAGLGPLAPSARPRQHYLMPIDDETQASLSEVRALAGASPFGESVKITVVVTPRVGRKLVDQLDIRFVLGGMDAQGRPTHAIEVDDVTIEWLAPHAQPTPDFDAKLPPTSPTKKRRLLLSP
jgi:hypothetical protein